MRSLRAASKQLLQIIPTKVMWLPYLQVKSQRVQNAAAREFIDCHLHFSFVRGRLFDF